MTDQPISAEDHNLRKSIAVLDSDIAYVDTGAGAPIVFLHGNPTWSYLWRNVIPHCTDVGRCLAPDLIGMGQSGKNPNGSYRFADHVRFLDAWFDALEISNAVLVGHDWGGALGFHWAARNPDRVRGIAYMETIVAPMRFAEWPEEARNAFQSMRSEAGEDLILHQNMFVEKIIPVGVMRDLDQETHDAYRKPFAEPGEGRRPTLTWPREIPIDGVPADVQAVAEAYGAWLAESDVPKLFINAEPGRMMARGNLREICRTWPNQHEVTVAGLHYIQEDSPNEIGEAIATFVRTL
jgi:haloalkane dehalogenase